MRSRQPFKKGSALPAVSVYTGCVCLAHSADIVEEALSVNRAAATVAYLQFRVALRLEVLRALFKGFPDFGQVL